MCAHMCFPGEFYSILNSIVVNQKPTENFKPKPENINAIFRSYLIQTNFHLEKNVQYAATFSICIIAL